MTEEFLSNRIWYQEIGKWVLPKIIINHEILNNFFGKEVGKIYSTKFGFGQNNESYRLCFLSAERVKFLEYPNVFVYKLKVFLFEDFVSSEQFLIKDSVFFETDKTITNHLLDDFLLEA